MINQKWSEYKDYVKLDKLNKGIENEMLVKLPDGKEIELMCYVGHDWAENKRQYYVVANDQILIITSWFDAACTAFCSILDYTRIVLGGVEIDNRPSEK